jgi:hypothetical protein
MLALLIRDGGAAAEAAGLRARLEGAGLEVRELPDGAGAVSAPLRLAEALVRFEGEVTASNADLVALAGEDDEILAAALVAAKLEVPIEIEPTGAAQGGNRRVIELLAGESRLPTLSPR